MIPKKIHYCWFGRGPKPQIFERCLGSWKKYAPDYEIIEWNEDNFDISRFPFAQEAYNCKKYAFVSDVARLSVVYEQGGIYLDTDVELTQSWDNYLKYDAFLFYQNHHQINTGLGFGALKNNPLIKCMLDDYQMRSFSPDKMNGASCPVLNTAVITKTIEGFTSNNSNQIIERNAFINFDEYCSVACHYGEFSWKDEKQGAALKYATNPRNWKLRKVLRNPKVFAFFDNHGLASFSKAYSFCVYDLIDYGVIYWAVRLIQKSGKQLK